MSCIPRQVHRGLALELLDDGRGGLEPGCPLEPFGQEFLHYLEPGVLVGPPDLLKQPEILDRGRLFVAQPPSELSTWEPERLFTARSLQPRMYTRVPARWVSPA
jgi:hypothetical protein